MTSGYYDDRYYDDGYGQYDEGTVDVSQVQSALARAGYYDGAIDGSFGPSDSERSATVPTGPWLERHRPD